MTEALTVPTVFGGKQIRVIEKGGETWMPCKDLGIAVPTETGVKKGDRYTFIANPYDRNGAICLPPGSLVYVPVVKK